MPATVTHAYFIMDVYDELPIGLKKLLMDHKGKLRMFAQSLDPFYFYNVTSFKSSKKAQSFALYFHQHKSQEFFINLVNYIKYNHYYQNAEAMAFLYGFISHYVLDTTIHPYIYYKTGKYQKGKKETIKYRNQHDYMETFLDNYLIKQKENIKPYAFKFYQYCFDLEPFQPEVKEIIDYAFQETFQIKHMSKFYYQALRQMQFCLKHFRYDKTGIKMKCYQALDLLKPKDTFQLKAISYHTTLTDTKNYLNADHQKWHHPCLKKETQNESFLELYRIALNRTNAIIKEVNAYLKGKKEVDLTKVFANLSYLTGKDCEGKYELKYFE